MNPVCPELTLLLDYVLDAVSDEEGSEIKAHLASCANCRESADLVRRTHEGSRVDLVEPPSSIEPSSDKFHLDLCQLDHHVAEALAAEAWLRVLTLHALER